MCCIIAFYILTGIIDFVGLECFAFAENVTVILIQQVSKISVRIIGFE